MLDVVDGRSEKLLVRYLMEIRSAKKIRRGWAADGEVAGEIAGGSVKGEERWVRERAG